MSTQTGDPLVSFLTKSVMDDLAHLAKNRPYLPTVAEDISTVTPGVGLLDAARIIAEKTANSPDDMHRTLWTIWNLHHLADSVRIPPADLPEALVVALEKYAPATWKDENLEEWREAAPEVAAFLRQLTPEHPLIVGRKAEQLAYLHQNLLFSAKLVTDVRPVFDAPAQRILEALVLHTLFLEYHDGEQHRRIAVALDADDVAQLRRLCDRAELKAATLKAAMANTKWPTAVVGEKWTSGRAVCQEEGKT
jgi:hypothetical protein